MRISEDLESEVRQYYAGWWERVEAPLARWFQRPALDQVTWVTEGLKLVKRKYRVQYISELQLTEMGREVTELDLGRTPRSAAEAIDAVARCSPRGYELSLAAKFCHFCWPASTAPYDQ